MSLIFTINYETSFSVLSNLKFICRIGLVGQEPVLFSGTIGENIRMGRSDSVSRETMLKSSEMANAKNFISKVRTLQENGGISSSIVCPNNSNSIL